MGVSLPWGAGFCPIGQIRSWWYILNPDTIAPYPLKKSCTLGRYACGGLPILMSGQPTYLVFYRYMLIFYALGYSASFVSTFILNKLIAFWLLYGEHYVSTLYFFMPFNYMRVYQMTIRHWKSVWRKGSTEEAPLSSYNTPLLRGTAHSTCCSPTGPSAKVSGLYFYLRILDCFIRSLHPITYWGSRSHPYPLFILINYLFFGLSSFC